MKKVIPATYSPVSSVTVHVYSGLKISWLKKLHRLSRDASTAKREPEQKTNQNKKTMKLVMFI